MAPSSSKFCPQVAHKKGLLRLVIRGLLQCFTGCMTRFSNHLEHVLPRKYRPKDRKTRTKDQRTRGPRDQRIKGPKDQGTRGPKDQATREPADQDQRSRGNVLFDTNLCFSDSNNFYLIGINVLFDRYPGIPPVTGPGHDRFFVAQDQLLEFTFSSSRADTDRPTPGVRPSHPFGVADRPPRKGLHGIDSPPSLLQSLSLSIDQYIY